MSSTAHHPCASKLNPCTGKDRGEKGLIVLDFGSTHSAAAVAIPKDVTRIEDVHTVRKFPTILRVVDDSTSPIQLAFVPPHTDHQVVRKKVQCPKSFIMQWENKPVFDDLMRQGIADMNEGLDLPGEREMVTLFLNGLWDLARQLLQTDFPDADSEPHVVLTYPGFWSEAERATLASAVEDSNIPGQACRACPIEYEKEQVAATYSVLEHHKNELEELKKAAGAFMVVDCGGMTADPAVFRFAQAGGDAAQTGNPPLQGSFVSEDRGCIAGGVGMDIRANNEVMGLIRSRQESMIGRRIERWEMPALQTVHQAGIDAFFLRLQKYIKPNFTGRNPGSESWFLGQLGGEDLYVRRRHMLRIFDEPADCIAKFIEEQIQEAQAGNRPKLLFLTGGLSWSPRVRDRIERELRRILLPKGIECPRFVWDPNHQVDLAVCIGAVCKRVPILLEDGAQAPERSSEMELDGDE